MLLRELGYRVESENGNDKLPVKIWGKAESGKRKAETSCKVSIEESSQFASALLLCAKIGNWEVEVVGENAEESPYVAMTLKLMKAFGWLIYKELSLDALSNVFENPKLELQQKHKELLKLRSQQNQILVKEWPDSDLQIDSDFAIFVRAKNGGISIEISRSKDLGDSIMTAITLAPFNTQPVKFTSLGRLRVQETERVVALRTELTKCGAKVVEEGDTLTVWPSPLHGAEIETYNDHRMAMCFAILGLKVPGIKIKNPACVKKTFPNFFQKLAAQPPHGLGATIIDAKSGRKLTHEELFAE